MNADRNGHLSRRAALGLAAAAGIGGAVLARSQAWAAPAKLAKEAVKYVEVSADEGKDCDDCAQFIAGGSANAPGSCKIVEGMISPHGHCIAFSPKPKR